MPASFQLVAASTPVWTTLTPITERKRVTTATDFGSTLTSLLSESAVKPKKSKKAKRTAAEDKAAADASDADDDDDVPAPAPVDLTRPAPKSNPILALSAKPLPPSRAAVSLERRAARALKAEKEERLDRARVRNVLEGWTPAPGANVGSQEFERGLRKTAQRGGECGVELIGRRQPS